MPVELVGGMVSPYEGAEESGGRGGPFNTDYITGFVRAHEAAGYDTALVGYGATRPDGWAIASHALHVTEKLSMLIAHRPGFAQPTLVARKAATLDNLTGGGRVAMHFITGGNEEDQHRDGDFVEHDDRYRRTAEYMSVLRRTLNSDEPFDHEGEFYRFEGAFSTVKPATQRGIPLYFGGASRPALDAGAANADVYMLWGEPLGPLSERIAAVRDASARLGRAPGFSVSLRPIVEDTESAAWARADRIGDAVEARTASGSGFARYSTGPNNTSVGAARLRAFRDAGHIHDERLWTRIAAGGNSTSLVGTAEQVAESLIRYYDLGCTTILIRGFDPLNDAITYGRELIPRIRALVAERDRTRELETQAAAS